MQRQLVQPARQCRAFLLALVSRSLSGFIRIDYLSAALLQGYSKNTCIFAVLEPQTASKLHKLQAHFGKPAPGRSLFHCKRCKFAVKRIQFFFCLWYLLRKLVPAQCPFLFGGQLSLNTCHSRFQRKPFGNYPVTCAFKNAVAQYFRYSLFRVRAQLTKLTLCCITAAAKLSEYLVRIGDRSHSACLLIFRRFYPAVEPALFIYELFSFRKLFRDPAQLYITAFNFLLAALRTAVRTAAEHFLQPCVKRLFKLIGLSLHRRGFGTVFFSSPAGFFEFRFHFFKLLLGRSACLFFRRGRV